MSKTILTVDDSVSMRAMVRMTLENAGYQVIEAGNGKEGLDAARRSRVDLLITDLNMPEMDGIEFIRNLRLLPQYKYLPIVMLTTESQEAKKQAGRAAGASGWIVKPFRSDQLILVARKFLN